jgi:hypothetical protein
VDFVSAKKKVNWWTAGYSNPRPPRCEREKGRQKISGLNSHYPTVVIDAFRYGPYACNKEAPMYVKDKQYLANIFKRISASVATVNAKIIASQQKRISVEELLASVALEQLSMQHEVLVVLATMVADPELNAGPLPELPTKMIGLN